MLHLGATKGSAKKSLSQSTFRKNESQSQKFSDSIPILVSKFSEFYPNPKILKKRSQTPIPKIRDWDPNADPWCNMCIKK